MKKFNKSSNQAQEIKHWYEFNKTKGSKAPIENIGRFAWIHFLEDPIFNSYLFQKFITHFTKQGKRVRAQKIFYRLFSSGGAQNKLQLGYFYQMIEKLRPGLAAVPVRFGKRIERVPMAMSSTKSYRKAMRYFTVAAYDRKYDKKLEEKIYNEFYDMIFTPGYLNTYSERDFKLALNNSHLKHFRRFGVF